MVWTKKYQKYFNSNDELIESKTDYTLEREGYCGNNALYGNCHQIRVQSSYSGSPNGFGGAKEWPTIDIHIAFRAGEEEKRNLIIEQIKKVVDGNFETGA